MGAGTDTAGVIEVDEPPDLTRWRIVKVYPLRAPFLHLEDFEVFGDPLTILELYTARHRLAKAGFVDGEHFVIKCIIPRSLKPYQVVSLREDGRGELAVERVGVRFSRNLTTSEVTGYRFRLGQAGWVEGKDFIVEIRGDLGFQPTFPCMV